MTSAGLSPRPAAASTTKRLTISDLPRETQKSIVSNCSQSDLICLSLVSKHFRELAASELYRHFHIVFPDEDDRMYDSPIDGLAGGLDTFVTSEYDYAKHLKDLSLDTLSAGPRAEVAYKPYLFNVSCGKFMNTLLLLTLRRAKSLEMFRWNIRVELSRPVYKALHNIDTLANVHIRLQSGPSLYETPPTLPYTASPAATPAASSNHLLDMAPSLPPLPAFAMPQPGSLFYVPPPAAVPLPPPPKPPPRVKFPKRTSLSKEPPTLSGFKNLKSLAVLDMDSLEIITEVKSCVRNSAGTLAKLKLSLSDSLGLQARKPPPDHESEESDPEDEFQIVPLPANPTPAYDDASGPARAFRAQEERRSQEAVLGRIFDIEPYLVKKHKKRPGEKEGRDDAGANPGADFIGAIKAVSTKLMKDLNGAGDISMQQQETLDLIEGAARKYVASEEAKNTKSGDANPASSPHVEPKSDADASSGPGLFDAAEKKTTDKARDGDKDVSPEDINVEEPEEQLLIESLDQLITKDASLPDLALEPAPAVEASSSKTPPPKARPAVLSPSVGRAMANLAAQKANFQTLADKLSSFEAQASQLSDEVQRLRAGDGSVDLGRITEAERQMLSFNQNIREIQREMLIVEAEIDDAERQIPLAAADAAAAVDDTEANRRRMAEYVRSTRGVPLRSLAIYLIPVKASILSKAVDIRALHKITLLNVGPQAPIWALFAKENKVEPLPLRKIFTDNVSTPFLKFVSQLPELHDLFVLERDTKYKPESFAPKTTVTMEQIRRLVLKKHAPTIRRLMIKNMTSLDWDLDEKATLLLARRARRLEELAASMNIRSIHILMQQLQGLVSLRALHIVQLRNDDTCVWVMRETKRFLVDSLSHYPDLKLEWISIDDDGCVEHIVRATSSSKEEEKKKAKGKEKAASLATSLVSDVFPPLPLDALDGADDSEDEDDDLKPIKLDILEGVHFSDVWGVKIFKKEIISGRI